MRTWRTVSSTVAGLLLPTFPSPPSPSRTPPPRQRGAPWSRRRRTRRRARARTCRAAYARDPQRPRTRALRSVAMSTGSSDEMEHLTPAASMRGSGCPSREGATPRSTLLRGRHVADDAARRDLGEQRRVLHGAHAVPQAVGAQHVERRAHRAGPATSPACGAALSPPSRAMANGRANSSGGNGARSRPG